MYWRTPKPWFCLIEDEDIEEKNEKSGRSEEAQAQAQNRKE